MTEFPPPNRSELARIAGGDPRMIRALESLFEQASTLTPADIERLTALISSVSDEVAATSVRARESNVILGDYIDFLGGPFVQQARRVAWDEDNGTVSVGLNADVALQIGQEVVYYAKNSSGATIPNGAPVVATGTVGASGKLTIGPAIGDGTYAQRLFIGAATEEIAANDFGYVTAFGVVRKFNTSAWSDGDLLYVSDTTPGAWVNSAPSAPNWRQAQAIVLDAAINGTILIRARAEHSVTELRDVAATSLASGDILLFNGTTWDSVAPSGWGVYNHGGGAQSLTASTRTQLAIDGATKIESQLPSDTGSLWDTTTDTITGRNGDAIIVKLQGVFTPDDATASDLILDVDIGGAVGVVEAQDFPITKGASVAHNFSWTFLAYTLDTWETNGGAVYATVDGPGDISDLRIIIGRIHKAK